MKRLNFFLAGALVALVYVSSRANEEHAGVADPLHVPKVLAVAPAPTVADRCDMSDRAKLLERIDEHNKAIRSSLIAKRMLPPRNAADWNLIIYPKLDAMKDQPYLCGKPARALWALIGRQGGEAAFSQASRDRQIEMIGEAAAKLRKLDENLAAVSAKVEDIKKRSASLTGILESESEIAPQNAKAHMEELDRLIETSGADLLNRKDVAAGKGKASVVGGALFNGEGGLYSLMKETVKLEAVAPSIPESWRGHLDNKPGLEEGQAFDRKMMRALWGARDDADPGKFGAKTVLGELDPAAGKALSDLFYDARKALNNVNQAVNKKYGGGLQDAKAKLKLAAIDRERQISKLNDKVVELTAAEIFEKAGRNKSDIKVDEMNKMMSAVRGTMATGDKAITFTAKGKDETTNTRDMPLPSGEADPKIIEEAKDIAKLLMQDKDVQANLAAAGLALKGDVAVNKDASADKENLADKKGDLTADLETPKDAADTLRDMAKKSGPGCTKNSMENLKASEEDKIGNMASGRIKDRTNALKDLNKAETTADKALKEAESKADDGYKACKAKLDSRRDSRTIGPAKYNEGLAACAQIRDGSKSSALGDFNKAMSEANSTYKGKVAKAGTEKQISKWEKDTTGKLNDEVVEAYNREIRDNQGALVSKFGSESGRIELGRSYASKKGQLSEDVPEEFVADYLKARWGNPPAALKDCREYIVKKNAEADAGMNRFVKEEDFPKWYDGRKGDISKEWGGDGKKEPAKKEPVKPGEKVKKIDPKAVDEELEKQP